MSALLGVVIVILVILTELVVVFLMLGGWLLVLERSSSATRAAEAALGEFLTEAEYRQVYATGYLEVASRMKPGRVYRVPRGHGWVHVVECGRCTEHLCLQPLEGHLPGADVVLMHMLLIQADEENYLRTANHFRNPVWWTACSGSVGQVA